jgi:sugar lactone lactonase YvrE
VQPPVEPLRDFSPPLVWPPAPDTARIKYLYSISKPADIGWTPSFFEKAVSFIAGSIKYRQIVRPHGIFFSPDELLLVTDPGLRIVHKFNLKTRQYDQIKKYDDKHLVSPIGVTMVERGRLYISDSVLKAVFVFDPFGKPVMEIGPDNFFKRPTGIAFHPLLKRLYVVDTKAHSVHTFDLQGNFLFSIGKRGTDQGEFNFPTSLTVDAEGRIYVNDSLNFRIQVFDPDGNFLYLFGKHGDGTGEFSLPKGVALDSNGHIYVTDGIFDSVQIFNRQGNLLLSFGESGQGPGKLWIPTSVFIDQSDRIFVSDSYNQRIQVFKFLEGNGT